MGQRVRDQAYHGPPFPYSIFVTWNTLQHTIQRPEKYITRAKSSVHGEKRGAEGHLRSLSGVFTTAIGICIVLFQ